MVIHFIRPFWLWMFLPASFYLLWIIFSYKPYNPWKKICDAHLLKSLIETPAAQSRIFFNISLLLFFMIAIFALAGPAFKKSNFPIYQDIRSLIIVLDLSAAMQNTDLSPDRLMRAKFKIRDLINVAEYSQIGLVLFTEEAFVASPLSQDAGTLNAILDEIDPTIMPVGGSDMSEGLKQGVALLKQAGVLHGDILLITASEPTAQTWNIATKLTRQGRHLNVLAMLESNAATQATINKLQQLAKIGGGRFYLFTTHSDDIQQILAAHPTEQTIEYKKIASVNLWQDMGPYFCLLLIPLALVIWREKFQYEKNH